MGELYFHIKKNTLPQNTAFILQEMSKSEVQKLQSGNCDAIKVANKHTL